MFHCARALARDRLRDHGRSDNNTLTTDFRPSLAHTKIDIHISLQSITLNRLATDRTHLVVIRSLVHDRRVFISDVGDVGRLINDRHVAFGRQERLLDTRRAEFSGRNEAILVGTDVVIIVRPIVNSGALIETRFGRKRRPADVFVALAP